MRTCSIVFRYFLPASIGLIGWNNLREVDYLFLRSWHSLLTTQRLEVILKSMFASGWIKSNTISWLIPSPKSFNINLKKYSHAKEEEKWIKIHLSNVIYLQTHLISSADANLNMPLNKFTWASLSFPERFASSSRVLSTVLIEMNVDVVKFLRTS